MSSAVLRIGELSRRTGVNVDVIRAWERRYGLLRPERTDTNYRLYSSSDVSRLRLMRHYLDKGIPAARAAVLVHEAQTAAIGSNPGVPADAARTVLGVLRRSLERYDEGPADRALEGLLGVFTPAAVLRDVVLPYLRELGERWARSDASVAQEHFASSFLEAWMLSMGRGWGRSGGPHAILACVPAERHTLGLIAFGVVLHDLGWRITYLGADTPLDALERAAAATEPEVLVLSTTTAATFGAVAGEIEGLSRRHELVLGGAGADAASADWLTARRLPADPIMAAHALRVREHVQPARARAA